MTASYEACRPGYLASVTRTEIRTETRTQTVVVGRLETTMMPTGISSVAPADTLSGFSMLFKSISYCIVTSNEFAILASVSPLLIT